MISLHELGTLGPHVLPIPYVLLIFVVALTNFLESSFLLLCDFGIQLTHACSLVLILLQFISLMLITSYLALDFIFYPYMLTVGFFCLCIVERGSFFSILLQFFFSFCSSVHVINNNNNNECKSKELPFREKPRDEEWNELNKEKIPLLLNYSQCQLMVGEYYSAIEHCSEVLKYEPGTISLH